MENTVDINNSMYRQAVHWQLAATRLAKVDNLASQQAWQGVDYGISSILKIAFNASIEEVLNLANVLIMALTRGGNQAYMFKQLILLRTKYTRTEETIHYYTIAINSRTNPSIAALLRACDVLCKRSMDEILKPLGRKSPPVMTYVDKGIGASILKAGLRLWDGKISPVAAIKITQHNLYRPTAIVHETGHQVAHILKWTEELEQAVNQELQEFGSEVTTAYAGWVSEMAADAFAFVHTGYAAVAALHDVVSGKEHTVFSYQRHDPHPITYIRVLLNIGMCRLFYGNGPWDNLEASFKATYDLERSRSSDKETINQCEKALDNVVKLLLTKPYRCFGNQSLSKLLPPERVSPKELERLEYLAGPSLYTSHAWIAKESLRILALNGLKIGSTTQNLPSLYQQQEDWMTRLGFAVELN
ncbi:MAG: hypothetical protein WBM98_00550 [Maribacter sp.]|uniref:hypothetical protein n=1 Tax=Maribacter sp. TaxID=1897614 RepID=UPI003C78EF5B